VQYTQATFVIIPNLM